MRNVGRKEVNTAKRTSFRIFSVSFFFAFALAPTGKSDTLISKLSVWKYYADAQYPDVSWNQSGYDDVGWPSGPGVLGFGETYIATTIPFGPDANNKYITTLFRHSFQLNSDPAEITQLTLSTNYDDGFVAYLNGVEVARRAMPGGAVVHSTLAASHEGGVYETIDISNSIGDLVQGTNLLSVEVHQTAPTSTDLVWDTELVSSSSQVEFLWSGGVTPNSAVVKAKLTQDGSIARLAASQMPDLSSPIYSNWDTAVTTENNRVVRFEVSGLAPRQRYYYALEVGGVLDTDKIGQFQTFPQDTATFTFAFGSCALTGSNHAVFETIRSLDPLFFFHLGDFHYQNIGVNAPNLFRQAYETVLASPNQLRLFQEVAIAYIWDDHDYGPNNSDSTAPGRQAARLTYQEYVPHYPLAAGSGNIPIYFTFDVGRVHFIVCDSRSARSPETAIDDASKTMLGTMQKAWFKQELLNAKSNYPLIVWVNTLPWIGSPGGGDGWFEYTNERRELADFIKINGIKNLCMISGDAHMLAIDDGTNSGYATSGGAGFPVMHGAALDQSGSLKGGPYSHGAFPGGGQFALTTVTDFGDSVRVQWSGRNYLNQERVGYSFTVCTPQHIGDLNRDGSFTASDVVLLVDCIFSGTENCNFCFSDVNCDGRLSGSDVVSELYRVFQGPNGPFWCGI
ncbi:MAG: alkaline phosphatase D family protein [candidate division Zixibacteria bacterium]|nr:alkaline phosphatase D family protein [candidate division Zixibacteria bacterium]